MREKRANMVDQKFVMNSPFESPLKALLSKSMSKVCYEKVFESMSSV
jgi:hypothetical protein